MAIRRKRNNKMWYDINMYTGIMANEHNANLFTLRMRIRFNRAISQGFTECLNA